MSVQLSWPSSYDSTEQRTLRELLEEAKMKCSRCGGAINDIPFLQCSVYKNIRLHLACHNGKLQNTWEITLFFFCNSKEEFLRLKGVVYEFSDLYKIPELTHNIKPAETKPDNNWSSKLAPWNFQEPPEK